MKITFADTSEDFSYAFGSGLEPIRKKEGERDYNKSKPKGKHSWKEQRRKDNREKKQDISFE